MLLKLIHLALDQGKFTMQDFTVQAQRLIYLVVHILLIVAITLMVLVFNVKVHVLAISR